MDLSKSPCDRIVRHVLLPDPRLRHPEPPERGWGLAEQTVLA